MNSLVIDRRGRSSIKSKSVKYLIQFLLKIKSIFLLFSTQNQAVMTVFYHHLIGMVNLIYNTSLFDANVSPFKA